MELKWKLKAIEIALKFFPFFERGAFLWKWNKKRVDPTFRKMALATEPFASRLNFLHIQDLHSQL